MRNDIPNPRVEKMNDAITMMFVDLGKTRRLIRL
jgi:hypothetical protein